MGSWFGYLGPQSKRATATSWYTRPIANQQPPLRVSSSGCGTRLRAKATHYRQSSKPGDSCQLADSQPTFQLARDLIQRCVNTRGMIFLAGPHPYGGQQKRSRRGNTKQTVYITPCHAPVG